MFSRYEFTGSEVSESRNPRVTVLTAASFLGDKHARRELWFLFLSFSPKWVPLPRSLTEMERRCLELPAHPLLKCQPVSSISQSFTKYPDWSLLLRRSSELSLIPFPHPSTPTPSLRICTEHLSKTHPLWSVNYSSKFQDKDLKATDFRGLWIFFPGP